MRAPVVSGADGLNTSGETLRPGDIVAMDGIADSPFDDLDMLLRVRHYTGQRAGRRGQRAGGTLHQPGRRHQHPRPRSGEPAAPGEEYLSVVIYGPVQVKAAGELEVGQRVTVDDTGVVRAMRRVEVEGVTLDEGGPSLGLSLDTAQDGMVWVLVNPQ
ncbi:MAG: hypothetical protein R2844_08340 [Caldilineales bacterium]